ncbi:MAG: TonB-dependent receptor [Rikenellaceae bacterium]
MGKHIFGVFLMLLCNTYALTAQTKTKINTDAHITGHVVDALTKEHIPYATVLIEGTTIGGISDATGHFLLKNLPVGEYTLTASFTGYKTVEKKVIIEQNKTIEVKMELHQQVLEMDEVVVTGSRNETNKRESSTIVNVLSAKLFEKTASNNVAEVLNFQSGLRVEYSCSNCGVPQLRINGLEGQYSQILLDSRPIFSSLATVYGLEQMPAGMIERVEVIRGGGSALFGSNAIGGVVNIITKEPQRNSLVLSNTTGVFQGGGTDVNTTINGSFVTDDSKVGVYIFGMVKNRSSYDRDNDGFSEIPKVNSETIGFRGYYKITPSSRITAEYHHIREFRRGGNLINRPPHEADIAEELKHGINGGGLKYDYLSKNYKHKVGIYTSLQNIDRKSYFGTSQNLDAYGTTKDFTLVAGGQYIYSMDKFLFMPSQLTLGVEYSDNDLKDTMLGYDRSLEQNSVCYGAFLQNEWKNEKLSFLIGGRLDKHNKVANPIFSPRINARYTPIRDIGLRLSYSSGYRAPQAYEEDLHVAAVGGEVAIITIDPNLKPEYSQSVSGSIDLYHSFGAIEANLLVEGFYTALNDVFTLTENGYDNNGNLLLERRNASGAIIKGVNMELKVGFTPKLILDGGFTFQSSRYKEALSWSDNVDIEPQKHMFRAPDTYGYVTLNYLPIKRLSASVTANYTGSMLVQHYKGYIAEDKETKTPNFWDLGLRLAYDLKISQQVNLQFSGGVKNVLDSFQKDIDRGVSRDAKYIYGPSMPRTYFFGLKLTI